MDKLKAWMTKEDQLRVMHSHRRLTIGPARNLAYEKSSGEYILCLDMDDRLAPGSLAKLLDSLDGKDVYVCSYHDRAAGKDVMLEAVTPGQLARCPVAAWTKVYRREMYVQFPGYMPEDVYAHYALADRCRTVGYVDFILVDYDNTAENQGAISRTFDFMKTHPANLLDLAQTNKIKELGLREEYVAGVIHNLADMWGRRDTIHDPEVKLAYMERFAREWRNFSSGIYVH